MANSILRNDTNDSLLAWQGSGLVVLTPGAQQPLAATVTLLNLCMGASVVQVAGLPPTGGGTQIVGIPGKSCELRIAGTGAMCLRDLPLMDKTDKSTCGDRARGTFINVSMYYALLHVSGTNVYLTFGPRGGGGPLPTVSSNPSANNALTVAVSAFSPQSVNLGALKSGGTATLGPAYSMTATPQSSGGILYVVHRLGWPEHLGTVPSNICTMIANSGAPGASETGLIVGVTVSGALFIAAAIILILAGVEAKSKGRKFFPA